MLKVGIIGTGGISHYHMSGYKRAGLEVTAACDIDALKLENFAKRHGVERTYTDYKKMMEKEDLDCVSVCTWNKEHMGATIAALRGGAHVLCEKPMAMNAKEALLMHEVAKEEGKLLMIGFVRRFGNDTRVLENFIKNGELGEIYFAKASYLRRNGSPGGWFSDKEFSGGGPLIDLGVHVIDLVRYLGGNPLPVAAYGVSYEGLRDGSVSGGEKAWSIDTGSGFNTNVEDFVSGFVKFDNGLTLFIETSFNLHIREDVGSIELFGTKSGAKIDPKVNFFTDLNNNQVNIQPAFNTALDFNGLFENEVAHFVDCVMGKTECKSPSIDGLILMKIIDALYQSAKEKREVAISF